MDDSGLGGWHRLIPRATDRSFGRSVLGRTTTEAHRPCKATVGGTDRSGPSGENHRKLLRSHAISSPVDIPYGSPDAPPSPIDAPSKLIDGPPKSVDGPQITLCETPVILYTPPITPAGAASVIGPAVSMSGGTPKETEQMKTISSALRFVVGACRAWLIGSPQNTDFAKPKSVARRIAWCHLPNRNRMFVGLPIPTRTEP